MKTDSISSYEVNIDVDSYSFLSTKKISNADEHRKNYKLNWKEIVSEYLSVGVGDVPHFASQYVFAKALHAGRTSERAEMQIMYLDIIDYIKQMIEQGELPQAV